MRLPKGAQADAPITVPDVTVGSATVEVVNANSLKTYAPTSRLLPAGGTTGQVLAKSSATDYATGWVDAGGGGGSGLPTGGTTGQALRKVSATDFDASFGFFGMNVVFNSDVGSSLGTTDTLIGSVTITPKLSTSTIAIFARSVFTKDAGTTRRTVTTKLLRGGSPGTQIGQISYTTSQNLASNIFGPSVHIAGDNTHGTTSPVTYSLYGAVDAGAASLPRFEIVAVELIS